MAKAVRTFIAIELPEEVREYLEARQEDLARAGGDVKWVRPDNIHLTLVFLGNVPIEEIGAVAAAVGGAAASHPILVHDVNGDGRNDLIIGAAHTYGLAWLEQKVGADGKRSFVQHWVETDFGQFHTLALGDLNGDGKADLVTGKRLFAHHGRDISCYDPLFAFWYDVAGGKFERHVLSYNHLPWYPKEKNINPPPNCVIAVGMKLNIADMDKDGDKDIVVAGKGGLYVFYNEGTVPRAKGSHRLTPEEEYPSWVPWAKPAKSK